MAAQAGKSLSGCPLIAVTAAMSHMAWSHAPWAALAEGEEEAEDKAEANVNVDNQIDSNQVSASLQSD